MNPAIPHHPSTHHDSPIQLRLTEWDHVEPGTEGRSALLRGLSFDAHPESRVQLNRLAHARIVTITERRNGLSVRSHSYVGRLLVGPLDMTIAPKIEWKRWLVLIGYALRLRGLVRSDRIGTAVDSLALQDLLVIELIAEVRDLMVGGLHRAYVRRRAMLAAPRGRIDFEELAGRGGIHSPTLPCRFTRRLDDSPINRLLLAGLRFAARLAIDSTLRSDARRLAHALEGTVSSLQLSDELVSHARRTLDRRTVRYVPALQLIELLLDGQGIALDGTPDRPRLSLPGFALDMNRLWQRLVSRVLMEWSDNFEIREEHSLRGVFRSNFDHPLRRSIRPPRPDFAAFSHGRLLSFLDAKYRDLWNLPLPREMLYQLAMYAQANPRGRAAMLYPTDAPQAVEERVDIRDPTSDVRRAFVALRPVRLGELERLISSPQTPERFEGRRMLSSALLADKI